jgi:hypothetical protein
MTDEFGKNLKKKKSSLIMVPSWHPTEKNTKNLSVLQPEFKPSSTVIEICFQDKQLCCMVTWNFSQSEICLKMHTFRTAENISQG